MESVTFDLANTSVRQINSFLHDRDKLRHVSLVKILNPNGAHNLACGIDSPITVAIYGHVGYYVAGMNQQARVTVFGNAGTGTAENMMSGLVHIKGYTSGNAGASAHGGTLIIDGSAGLRCGISLKGADIIVGGSVGSFSAFMAQAGRILICGDAGDALGDSLYEAVIYIKGEIKSLGADARLEPMQESDYQAVAELLSKAGWDHDPQAFKRVASAKQLYHWNANASKEY